MPPPLALATLPLLLLLAGTGPAGGRNLAAFPAGFPAGFPAAGLDTLELVALPAPADEAGPGGGRLDWAGFFPSTFSMFGPPGGPGAGPADGGSFRALLDLVLGLRDSVLQLQQTQALLVELVKCSCPDSGNCSAVDSLAESLRPPSAFHGFGSGLGGGAGAGPLGGRPLGGGLPGQGLFPGGLPGQGLFPGGVPGFLGGSVIPGFGAGAGGLSPGATSNYAGASAVMTPDGEVHGTLVTGSGDRPPSVTTFGSPQPKPKPPEPQQSEPEPEPAEESRARAAGDGAYTVGDSAKEPAGGGPEAPEPPAEKEAEAAEDEPETPAEGEKQAAD